MERKAGRRNNFVAAKRISGATDDIFTFKIFKMKHTTDCRIIRELFTIVQEEYSKHHRHLPKYYTCKANIRPIIEILLEIFDSNLKFR